MALAKKSGYRFPESSCLLLWKTGIKRLTFRENIGDQFAECILWADFEEAVDIEVLGHRLDIVLPMNR